MNCNSVELLLATWTATVSWASISWWTATISKAFLSASEAFIILKLIIILSVCRWGRAHVWQWQDQHLWRHCNYIINVAGNMWKTFENPMSKIPNSKPDKFFCPDKVRPLENGQWVDLRWLQCFADCPPEVHCQGFLETFSFLFI